MVDFCTISARRTKTGLEIIPKFIIKSDSKDLMIRAGDFYAVWVEDRGLWSTNENDVVRIIDKEIDNFISKLGPVGMDIIPHYMWDASSGSIDFWHKYVQKQCRDHYNPLDEVLAFQNTPINKEDYSSKRLPYAIGSGDISAYDEMVSTLYSPEERHKFEWAIGSIVSGESKKLQKFIVFYGAHGTGKSTVLNIIEKMFDGYCSSFDSKALGSANSQFALESFKNNPLVSIQQDGDLSHIEDNTRLNSLVSHETMSVNVKHKSLYDAQFKTFLFMGTNKPVKITDAKSGIIRRLIDVNPTGVTIPKKEYLRLLKEIQFEYGAIAQHCKEVYEEDPNYYDDYIPTNMLSSTNDFYNFVEDNLNIFDTNDIVTLKQAWEAYKQYADETKMLYPFSQRAFKEELKNYFEEFYERYYDQDSGDRMRSVYKSFIKDKFTKKEKPKTEAKLGSWLNFNCEESLLDDLYSDCPAQYANAGSGTPKKKWDECKTILHDIDTTKLHYVKIPESHIVIDFDIPDENGNKCFQKNFEEASKWPKTYAELSKSGEGIHLHYIYSGDTTKLKSLYAEHIEVKIFNGNASLRRKLTKCNDIPVSTISSGLPFKEEKKVVDTNVITDEKWLRSFIKKNMRKEIHPGTKPSIEFIKTKLDELYEKGVHYDVSDMRRALQGFASQSTNHAAYCLKLVDHMHLKSDDASEAKSNEEAPIVFFDCEVFPNLFLVNWKFAGKESPVNRMINPKPKDIEKLMSYRLIGFNCRKYDNHMLYACYMGYTNEMIYNLSHRITQKDGMKGKNDAFFSEAYNISYTDIYDFSSKKQSLKKFEIELKIHHKELGLPWDQPVPEEKWPEVAEYCDYDVLATEATFNALTNDFLARKILAKIAGGTVNDTTNTLTAKLIFGNERNPQTEFRYRFLGDIPKNPRRGWNYDKEGNRIELGDPEYTVFDEEGRPCFPGYTFEKGVSMYRGIEVGEGGEVYAEPGMYGNVPVLDVESMHPSSAENEMIFGERFTKKFSELKLARTSIKHSNFDVARGLMDGKLSEFLDDPNISPKDLAYALKIAINAVYGQTCAHYPNKFRDPRNVDNFVAKRGALFMINLLHEVKAKGFKVAHIKTDSIKIPDATPDICEFVIQYGKMYGYHFEYEDVYDRMCLVNDAVYIAKEKENGKWEATGTQFAVPYVFKTLFSHEPIEFEDLTETKQVKNAIYLDMNENLPDVELYENEKDIREKIKSFDWTKDGKKCPKMRMPDISDEELEKIIASGHDYHFIGKVGLFCPIKDGLGGGLLATQMINEETGAIKYNAVTGSKGYRWLEAEDVQRDKRENDINLEYFENLAEDAKYTINQFGDFDWFVSDEAYQGPQYDEHGAPLYFDDVQY